MIPTNRTLFLLPLLALSSALSACAGQLPDQLADARSAYRAVQQGPAAAFSPAALHEAEMALKLAEQTYEVEGGSHRTTDRAYVAMRKAQLADVTANMQMTQAKIAAFERKLVQQRGSQLASAQEQLAEQERQRREAEERARRATEELARIADVRQDERGTVITLSGSVLFASNQTRLLPAAQRRLEQVASALQDAGPSTQIVVEGHTDSRGSPDYNLELSAKRAEAVREFLVARGVDRERVRAQGLGLTRPVATNETVEGRANNRRVEIVLGPEG
jgi:outer membrane protein OmpA-like peptidoglycan-associated protein